MGQTWLGKIVEGGNFVFNPGGARIKQIAGQAISQQNSRDLSHAESGVRMRSAGAANQGFNFGAMSKGQNTTGQRLDGLATHQAQEDSWNFMQDYASGIAGNASIATGMAPGAISAPEQRSTSMMGLAGSGFLGGKAKSAFGYSDDTSSNGYYGEVMRAQEGLRSISGADQLAFQQTSVPNAIGAMPRKLATAINDSWVNKGDAITKTTPMEKIATPDAKSHAEQFTDKDGNFSAEAMKDGFIEAFTNPAGVKKTPEEPKK
jgi:hypothetical protein